MKYFQHGPNRVIATVINVAITHATKTNGNEYDSLTYVKASNKHRKWR